MEQLFRILIFLEMLFVNLIITHRCSSKKYSVSKVITELTLFTILVFLVSFLIRLRLNSYISEGIIILIGFTYYFPLKHLYNETTNRILAIMFFSWIHSMTVTSFSIQIGILLEMKNDLGLALAIQSIIYLFSTRMVIKFVKNEFLYILKNITSELDKYFISLSLAQFVTIVIIQLYFRKGGYSYWGIIAVTLIGLTATISYHLIYIMVRNFKSINSLKEIAYWDNLTAIKNRLALFIDCEKLIAEKKPFTVIYMDLDNFKKVNDLYGHSVGDNYLKQFTKASIEAIGHHGSLYRMSGDEFVCIYDEDEIDIFLETFNDKIMDLFEINIPFLGVSIGYAKFPDDADSLEKLIDKADTIMYKVKSIKHKPFVMTREWDVPKSFKQ